MKPSHPLSAAGLAALLATAPAWANEAAAPAKPDPAKGQATATTVCAACHMSDGTRGLPANPILQGQHAPYMVKQLTEFKAGKRASAVMPAFAGMLSEDDMRNVAAFFASKPAVPGVSKNKDTIRLGERIWRGGIAEKGIPACAGCHGPNGAGIPAQYPRLAGQHYDYLLAQMLAFRDGVRTNNVPMTGVTARMNDAEIKAVSDYAAGLQ